MGKLTIMPHARQRYAERIVRDDSLLNSELDELINREVDLAVDFNEHTKIFCGTEYIVRDGKVITIIY